MLPSGLEPSQTYIRILMSALTDVDFEEFSEPKFKYKRIQNDLAKIFVNDAASCLVVHSKFLAVGTQRGRVYVFDHAGNKISGNNIPPHAVDVNQISIDTSGEYLASCANDGKIVVHGLCGSSDFSQIVTTDRPIKSVALDPNFGRFGSGQIFVTGDRCLTLHEKGLLGSNRQSIIYDGKERDGWIHAISWQVMFLVGFVFKFWLGNFLTGVYVLFGNETGVRLFDKSQKLIITHVSRRHDFALRSELYPARLIWFNDHSFAIGWADRVTVCSIKENRNFGPTLLNAAAKML
uniref:Vps41 beta-propeller domain-containing protein n=1 Tax=Romanomermis culicivorax TaxID=13658 RepID=A0A915JDJ9_ROMCU